MQEKLTEKKRQQKKRNIGDRGGGRAARLCKLLACIREKISTFEFAMSTFFGNDFDAAAKRGKRGEASGFLR